MLVLAPLCLFIVWGLYGAPVGSYGGIGQKPKFRDLQNIMILVDMLTLPAKTLLQITAIRSDICPVFFLVPLFQKESRGTGNVFAEFSGFP